jgi:hypothetical protein
MDIVSLCSAALSRLRLKAPEGLYGASPPKPSFKTRLSEPRERRRPGLTVLFGFKNTSTASDALCRAYVAADLSCETAAIDLMLWTSESSSLKARIEGSQIQLPTYHRDRLDFPTKIALDSRSWSSVSWPDAVVDAFINPKHMGLIVFILADAITTIPGLLWASIDWVICAADVCPALLYDANDALWMDQTTSKFCIV